MIDGFGMRNPLQYGLTKRPSATQFLQAANQPATGGAVDPLRLMQLRQSVVEQQMRPQRTAAQQMMAMPTRMKQTPAVKPPSLGDRISGMMPAAGTPQAAGLGAAGAKMLELSGYSDRPIAMSQILGEAAQAYTTAKKETAAEQAATLKAKQELERQRKKDELEARLTEARIFEIMNKSPDETSLLQNLRAAGIDPASERGQQIIVDYLTKKGGGTDVTVTMGSGDAMPLEKANIKTVQMDVIKGARTEDMLADIEATFRPEFQEIPTRISLEWSEIKSKLGSDLTDDEATLLRDYSEYQQNAIYAINQYIRDITGAQMSIAEAQRLALALPQVGTGVFDGDSPERFKSKLDNAIRQVKRAQERANYFLRKGIEPTFDYKEREFSSEEGVAPELAGTRYDTDVAYKVYGRSIDVRSESDMNWLKKKELENISKKYEAPEYANLSSDEKVRRIIQERDALFS